MLETFGIERSLSAKGCPYDNAVDESTNRILKAELVHRETFGTTRELRVKLSDYVHWCNNFRIHSTLATCRRSSSGRRGCPSRNRPNRCCQSNRLFDYQPGLSRFFDWGGCYVAESLRDEDCISKAHDVHLSLISFRDRTIRSYMILLFKDGEFDDSQIPRTIRSFLDPSLLAH